MKLDTVTRRAERWYDDACGTAHALELIGERWSLLIVRELMFGPRRFGELRRDLPGISANVLTQRLEGLIRAHIARRRRLPSPANAQVYELTAWGYEAEPAIQTLGRWAARSPDHDPTLPISAASIMLSLRTMIDGERARGLGLTLAFRFPHETYVARLAEGALPVTRGEEAYADANFDTDPATLAAIVYGKQPIAAAEADGTLRFAGDRAKAQAFIDLFHLPAKAEVE